MSGRLINLAWVMAIFLVAVLTGGGVANHLNTLEQETLKTWQTRLETSGLDQAAKTSKWLGVQRRMLEDIIAAEPVLMAYLRDAHKSQPLVLPPSPEVVDVFQEKARLKYGLNHSYLFAPDGQLLLAQEQARNLPLKIREDLALAYQTGLNRYMFFSSFENKIWFIASYRLQSDGINLGYGAFMLEASTAMDALRDKKFRWHAVDFNLARRVGDEDMFFVAWPKSKVITLRLNIAQTNLPLFRGASNTFGIVTPTDAEKRLAFVAGVPQHPFWQHVSSIPMDVAMADVRQARLFYLMGYGVLLLLLMALMVGFLRRMVRPGALPVLSNVLTQPRKASPSHHAHAPQLQKEKPLWQNVRRRVGGVGGAFSGGLKARFNWKARDLSPEERERLKTGAPAPQPTNAQQVAPSQPAAAAPEASVKESSGEKTPEGQPENLDQQQQAEADRIEQEQVKQIHDCIQNEKYRLYFQPILETKSKDKVMFETLLRLVDPKGDLMQPMSFFPLAIKHGFVDQVDDMVIVASLRRHMEILTQGKNMILSINLSYGAFSSMNFMNTYQEGLKTGKLKPELLNFELSSREIIEDEAAMKFVREMQKSGAKFSVNFFGDPEKTVKAAKKLKFDYMKVDCLKFDGLFDGDAGQVERFRNVVTAGQKHGLPLIAEKIETKSVMLLCEKLGVPYIQGFYLAEPSPKLSLGW